MNCKRSTQSESNCPRDFGTMPDCAPLAVSYIPFQQPNSSKYSSGEALSQGTLYPALNLPFHLKKVGAELPKTPMTELQALGFVIHELNLYLDTHSDDEEAFALLQKYVALEQSARATYLENNGPLTVKETAMDARYTWVDGPWPWERQEVDC